MKNLCVRISKAIVALLAFTSVVSGAQAQAIRVNGVVCTATPLSVAVTPSGTDITVPSQCFGTVVACSGVPSITSFSPLTGPVGTTVTVNGSNLCAGATVTINGVSATGVSASGGSLTAVVAAGTTGTGQITVTTSGNPVATSTASFTVNTAPTITGVAANAPQTYLLQNAGFTVAGANFIPGAITLSVGGIAVNPYASSATTATAVLPGSLPNGATTITATTNGQTTPAFSILVGPQVVQQTCTTPGADCTIEGDVIPTPSRTIPGGQTAARLGKLNGAGPSLNAYAASDVATKCANSTPAITRLWQHNINFATYQSSGANDYPYLQANEAMTWKFVAPAEGSFNQFQYAEGTQVFNARGFMSVSNKPCDFDVSKLVSGPNYSACFASESTGISIYYKSTAGTVQPYECKIVPGQTYYLNLRMQDARPAALGGSPTLDSCAASGAGTCGGYVQIR